MKKKQTAFYLGKVYPPIGTMYGLNLNYCMKGGEMERREKICPLCKFYVVETEELEGECLEGEDVKSEEFCHNFEKEEKDGEGKGK
jgi:hypothetical protein